MWLKATMIVAFSHCSLTTPESPGDWQLLFTAPRDPPARRPSAKQVALGLTRRTYAHWERYSVALRPDQLQHCCGIAQRKVTPSKKISA